MHTVMNFLLQNPSNITTCGVQFLLYSTELLLLGYGWQKQSEAPDFHFWNTEFKLCTI